MQTTNNQKIQFLIPIIWVPLNVMGIERKQASTSKVVWQAFCTIAEFYFSYSDRIAHFVNYDSKTNHYQTKIDKNLFPLINQSRSLMNYLRVPTLISVAIVTLRGISAIAVKVGKEKTPLLIQAMQTPLNGFVLNSIGVLITLGALTAVVLTAVKVILRCTRSIEISTGITLLNQLPEPSEEEID